MPNQQIYPLPDSGKCQNDKFTPCLIQANAKTTNLLPACILTGCVKVETVTKSVKDFMN
jgi:hypothetical protein